MVSTVALCLSSLFIDLFDLIAGLLLVVLVLLDFVAYGFFLRHSLCMFVGELSNDYYFKGQQLFPLFSLLFLYVFAWFGLVSFI